MTLRLPVLLKPFHSPRCLGIECKVPGMLSPTERFVRCGKRLHLLEESSSVQAVSDGKSSLVASKFLKEGNTRHENPEPG